jgi:hypothetical protein
VGALEGAAVVGGLSALGAALYGLGIPKDSVVEYETALKADKFLLMVHGTAQEAVEAKSIIAGTQNIKMSLHSAKLIAASVI